MNWGSRILSRSYKIPNFTVGGSYNSRLSNQLNVSFRSISSTRPWHRTDSPPPVEPTKGPSPAWREEPGSAKDITCTVFDQDGNVTAVCKRFSRKDFLDIDGLHPRDLRHIDNAQESIIPSILVRPHCILVNMLNIRAIISYNRVLVLDSATDRTKTSRLGLFVYDLENKLRTSAMASKSSAPREPGEGALNATESYEMKALESILMNAVASLDVELKAHLSVLNEILQDLEDHVDRDLLRELLIRNKSLSKFCQKSLLVRNVINDVLDSDEDLVGLYLTEKHNGLFREETDHAEAELLLESYYKQTDEIVQQAEQVLSNIKSTEEIINIMLDSNRNSLMLMELKVCIGTLGFTVSMLIASLYGMNLKNYMEESPLGMAGVFLIAAVSGAAVTIFNLKRLATAKKVTIGANNGDLIQPMAAMGRNTVAETSRKKPYRNKQVMKRALFHRIFSKGGAKDQKFDNRQKKVMWRWLSDGKIK